MNEYHVIGLMSGTSLDGVDVAYFRFTYKEDNWIYKILYTDTLPYSDIWIKRLKGLNSSSAAEFVQADHDYGRYLGELVQDFCQKHQLKPDFTASHGHTIFHQPGQHLSWQLGHGAYLAAAAGMPVVCDFRTLDIALGGQGAPLVPIGDQLLFRHYDFCLNLGGIANVSFEQQNRRLAYDICACNMLLNTLADELHLPYDQDGEQARQGQLLEDLFRRLNAPDYFSNVFPKSLGKEWVDENSLRVLQEAAVPVQDRLHTTCHHIAFQVAQSVKQALPAGPERRVLLTGGGAFNTFLVELIRQYLGEAFEVVVPEPELVNYKEALIFAFLGVLRWRQEPNCLQSVTGAAKDNVGGAVYYS